MPLLKQSDVADRVNIATLNTWKGSKPYLQRLELICNQARLLSPNILLLQEALEVPTLGYDTADSVSNMLGYKLVIQSARLKERKISGSLYKSSSNLSILTRGQIVSSIHITLSTDDAEGERISQVAEIILDNMRILVVNIHLTYLPKADCLRRQELEDTIRCLPPIGNFDLAIMGEDFNSAPESPEIKWLLTETPFLVEEACMTKSTPITTVERDEYQPQQIDYLFKLGTSKLKFSKVHRVFDQPHKDSGLMP